MRQLLALVAVTVACTSSSGAGQTVPARVPKNHRASTAACPQSRAPGGYPYDSGTPLGTCVKDTDCTAGKNGRCLGHGPGAVRYDCSYDECFADGDCAGTAVCQCRAADSDVNPNQCLGSSQCRVDADCGASGYCSPSTNPKVCGVNYYCHKPADTCVDDSDCTQSGGLCSFDASAGHWACAAACPSPP